MDLPAELLELQHRELGPEDYDVINGLSDVPKLANKMLLVLVKSCQSWRRRWETIAHAQRAASPSAEPNW